MSGAGVGPKKFPQNSHFKKLRKYNTYKYLYPFSSEDRIERIEITVNENYFNS